MKTTSSFKFRVSLSTLLLFVGVVFFLPKISFASNLISQQPISNQSISSTVNANQIRQTLPTGIHGTVGNVSINFDATHYETVKVCVSIQDQNTSTTYKPTNYTCIAGDNTGFILDTNSVQTLTVDFTSSLLTLDSTHSYVLIIFNNSTNYGNDSIRLYGTTSLSYSGCIYNPGNVACQNSVTSLAYTITSNYNLQFNSPLSYSTIDSGTPVGQDFTAWIIQVSYLPTTSTPYTLTVSSSGGSSSVTLPANSTSPTLIQNIQVPKNYNLVSTSTSSPTFYSATATLSINGQNLTNATTYFGITSSSSPFTFGNFLTPQGYISPTDIDDTLTGCAKFASSTSISNSIARGLCNASAFLFIPPPNMFESLKSIPEQYSQKFPFVYLSQIRSTYLSFDPNSVHYISPTVDTYYQNYDMDIKASSTVFNFTIISFDNSTSSIPSYAQPFFSTMRVFLNFSLYVTFAYTLWFSIYEIAKRIGTGGSK